MEIHKKVNLRKGTVIFILNNHRELDRIDRYESKEPETIRWIEEEIHDGDVFWDVGANIGQYSIYCAAAAKGNALVYSFEPESANFAKLNRNIAANGFQKIIIPYNIALADVTQLSVLNVTVLRPGYATHQLELARNRYVRKFGYCHSQGVLTASLDDLVYRFSLRPPNHLKIDVDGVEDLIIEGGKKVLSSKSLRTVLVEVNPGNASAIERQMAASHMTISKRSTDSSNIIFRRDI